MTPLPAVQPPTLEDVLALAGGTRRTVRGSLAPGVQTWVASPEQGLTAAIELVRGAEKSIDTLARLAPSSLTVVAGALSDDACWVELTRRTAAERETCIAGLTYDDAGRVSRLVWVRAPLVPASEIAEGTSAPSARPILEGYFADLMSSEFREAAAHFTINTIYSHPPYAGGTDRVLFRGREALRRGWVTERGPSPAQQIITALWQRGGRVFVEGIIEGVPDGGTFFSTAQITSDGEIARYVAFYSGTRIPAAARSTRPGPRGAA